MYIYTYGSDRVIFLGRQKQNKNKNNYGNEICNLFRACLYFEEDILNQNRYRGRTTTTTTKSQM